MKIKNWHMGLIVLIVIFGGIAMTMAFNLWKTEGGNGQGIGDGQGSGGALVPVTFKVGEFAGEYNPADIRGSYNFGHISELWEIPLAELGTAFGLEAIENLAYFECKDLHEAYANLEEDVEIGTGSVKMFVALYTDLPFTLLDDEYLPQSAVELLKAKANLTEDQVAFLDTHSVDISGLRIVEPSTITEGIVPMVIKGNTTFGNLLDWGIPEEEIEAIIGGELPSTSTTIRDFASQEGLDFGHINASLQAKLIVESSTVTEGVAPTEESEESVERIIKAWTTFKDVLDWGITEEEIEVIIGEKLPATGMTIRDFAAQKGLDFGHIKAPLQAKVDALGAK